jgi:small subunit ribosomal protein S18
MAKKPQRGCRAAPPNDKPKKNLLASMGLTAVDFKDTAAPTAGR